MHTDGRQRPGIQGLLLQHCRFSRPCGVRGGPKIRGVALRGGKTVQGENVNWDVFEEYGSGKYPSLALIKNGDTT